MDYRKQMRIKKLAMVYLKQHHLLDRFIRFDIAEVSCGRAEPANGAAAPVSVNVIRNAF